MNDYSDLLPEECFKALAKKLKTQFSDLLFEELRLRIIMFVRDTIQERKVKGTLKKGDLGPVGRSSVWLDSKKFASLVDKENPEAFRIDDVLYLQKIVENHIAMLCTYANRIRSSTMTFVGYELEDICEGLDKRDQKLCATISKKLEKNIKISPYHIQLVEMILNKGKI